MSLPDKIKALRERSGLTIAQTAKLGGWAQPSSYHRYENASDFRRKWLPMEVAERLMRAFVGRGDPPISTAELLALVQPTSQSSVTPVGAPRVVEVIAVVEAGVWREAFELPQEERRSFPAPILPGYEGKQVFALEVRGHSMNKVYPSGSIAFFVSPEDQSPQPGNIVVALAKRGDLYETTLKEYRPDSRGRPVLWPLSTDPKHQRPIYPDESGAESVEIIGVAIGKFEMLPPPSSPKR